MSDKFIFAMYVIGIVTVLQGIAWFLGINGQIWAFTSLVIGVIAGAVLKVSIDVKNKKKVE